MAMTPTFFDRFSELAAAGILASFGGAAQALYQLQKGDKPFSLISFLICIFLSFFVGQVVGSLIPESLSKYHDGLLLMAGFSVFPLLDVFNAYMVKLVKGLLTKITPADLIKEDKDERN
jgi:hypothetical protein